MNKGTKLYSILKFKCPYCHEGEFFVDRNPYRFKTMGDVRLKCNVCERSYSKEPGFYQGAMYVSYSLGVTLFIISYILALLIAPEASTTFYVVLVVSIIVLLTPLLFSLSKIIYGNIFLHYIEDGASEKNEVL